ncbi:MAG: Flp pilus assembly protein CpaB [Syntrophobacteraceae bacterium]|jgi:pilus assembly protein CpaB
MGKLKALIPFVLALVVALTATVLIYNWMKHKSNEPSVVSKVVPEDRGHIVLAGADLSWGTKISADMVKTAPIATDNAPAGSFANPAELVGRVLVAPVKQNEPIMESKLAPRDVTTGGVSAVVHEGMRAIAVGGDKVMGLAGFIQPGNYVDILVTVQDPQNDKLHYTKTVLENIRVLATGTMFDNKGDSTKPAPVDVFTVEVTPEDAERLSLAAVQGKLHFALRNVADRNMVYTLGSTVGDALEAYRPRMQKVSEPETKMEPQTEAPERKVGKMEIINGEKREHVSF